MFVSLANSQNSTPMRFKESYFVNLPQYANKVMEFAMSVLNEKLKKRVIVSIPVVYPVDSN